MKPRCLVPTLTFLATASCAANFHDYVASVASDKMSCPKEKLQLTQVPPEGYEDAYRAEGCGHSAVFAGRCSLGMCSSQMLPRGGASKAAESEPDATSGVPTHAPPANSPQTVSLQMHNRCPRTVKLFLGADPQFGSGTATTMSSNEVRNFTMSHGDTLWLVDDSGKPLSSTSASGGPFADMVILESCSGFGPYR